MCVGTLISHVKKTTNLVYFFPQNFEYKKQLFFSECYEDYSDQTIRTIALQDLQTGTIGRSKCKDLIEVTDANYIQASEEIVTDVVLGNEYLKNCSKHSNSNKNIQ